MIQASKEMQKYFDSIKSEVNEAYKIAGAARKKGFDPELIVDVALAENMAERVEGLISAVAPQFRGSSLIKRLHELEKKYGALAWEVALIIAEEVAQEKFFKFKTQKEAIEMGIRTGFAYHTLGIVSAPLEGFTELKLKKNKDGKEYFAIKYSGPIRGAGGTGASVSVIIADYVRSKLGFAKYDPSEEEINRYVTELQDYHERITNLQYAPSEKELKFFIKNVPVEIDGDPTEKIDVSNYKDLPRVETNRIRGGMCLVVSMLCLKAPKLWKRLSKWGNEFGLEWGFLEEFLKIQGEKKAGGVKKSEDPQKVMPNKTFIADLVAGRPVLSGPMAKGGFRLRYGRTRTSGFSAASIHPSTSHLLNKYLAVATQLKVERPGKAAAITHCDYVDGPIVLLKNGTVLKIETENEARNIVSELKEVLFLGDILFNYGDFSENNHMLVPPGYCEEWWIQELERAAVSSLGILDNEKLAELVSISADQLNRLLRNPIKTKISARAAINLSKKLNIPLHPAYTYYWDALVKKDLIAIITWFKKANIKIENNNVTKVILPFEQELKRKLEIIGIPHSLEGNEFVVIEKNHAHALVYVLGIEKKDNIVEILNIIDRADTENMTELLSNISKLKLRDKSGTFIGARMGRPEKSKIRKMEGSPHILFPIGAEGGRLRSFQAALEAGSIRSDFPQFHCAKCDKDTIFSVCEECGKQTKKMFYCEVCGWLPQETCQTHGPTATFKKIDLDIKRYFNAALSLLKTSTYPDLIKGVRGTANKDRIPEHLVKGLLRAKHGTFVNKDGTTRYDMSELPITHFRPREIRTSVEQLKEMGYTHDTKGRNFETDDQILELRPQDIILPSSTCLSDEAADTTLFRIAQFVDELLVKLYGTAPFYNFKDKSDTRGSLVIGLAPHISAGMIGRVIGFSDSHSCYAHPLWHAALRRDCDGDEACVMLLMDALLNFSHQYLPDKRGGRTMDAPLVLTSILNPAEVDDMVHGMDVAWSYPLDFYEAAGECKFPNEIKIEQLKSRLGSDKQYEGMGYTHEITDINAGIQVSAYKTLPSMREKLDGQMEIAEKVRAVNASIVAGLVIEKHFLKDTKGNLRKFSMQQFRCVGCNEKFRRPPLIGKCTKCKGKIIFTISEGSVVKYLEPSISLAEKYNVPDYLKQALELTKRRIEGVFGKDKEKQEGLGKWFG